MYIETHKHALTSMRRIVHVLFLDIIWSDAFIHSVTHSVITWLATDNTI